MILAPQSSVVYGSSLGQPFLRLPFFKEFQKAVLMGDWQQRCGRVGELGQESCSDSGLDPKMAHTRHGTEAREMCRRAKGKSYIFKGPCALKETS